MAIETVTLKEHLLALRVADQRALEIKQIADEKALGLASEIQKYKDEKANELRKQIESERGLYPTKSELASAIEKLEATIKPFAIYVSSQQGQVTGLGMGWKVLMGFLGLITTLLAIYAFTNQ